MGKMFPFFRDMKITWQKHDYENMFCQWQPLTKVHTVHNTTSK